MLLTLILNHNFTGCGKCWVLDGNWKLAFAHCMFPVQNVPVAIKLSLPNTCPREPKGNNAFCEEHCEVVRKLKIPTRLREFLAYSGVEGNCNIPIITHYM